MDLYHQILSEVRNLHGDDISIKETIRDFIHLLDSNIINERICGGKTVLIIASYLGLHRYIESLINAGHDVDAQDDIGLTALMWARGNKKLDIIRTLIKYKCNLDAQDSRGETALMRECYFGDVQTVSVLLAAGCNVNLQSETGNTALNRVCSFGSRGRKRIVKMLIEYKCDLNAKNMNGQTPLMCAIDWSQPKSASLLIKFGCKLDITDFCGVTALGFAFHREDYKSVFELLSAGCRFNSNDKKNMWSMCERAEDRGISVMEKLNDVNRNRIVPILCARKYIPDNVFACLPLDLLKVIFGLSMLKIYK